ncbi:MAG: hypothetical protein QOE72_3695, partial [Chloroflexota bacterium]|nr:hypothetical protein [Chloroflexota bacterium]
MVGLRARSEDRPGGRAMRHLADEPSKQVPVLPSLHGPPECGSHQVAGEPPR